MFKKITKVNPKIKKTVAAMPAQYPIHSTKALLADKELSQLLARLPRLVNVPMDEYDFLYKSTIENFAQFVQALPSYRVAAFNKHLGFLTLGLERAYKTLTLYRREFPIKNIRPEDMPVKLALWSYALFTAGLLYGIGDLSANFWIATCDAKGRHPKRWHPNTGPMILQGEHYKFSLNNVDNDTLAFRISPLLARQIIPEEGLDWIACDAEILEYWLAILQNDERAAGVFAKIILHAQDELIQLEKQAQHSGVDHEFDHHIEPEEEEKKSKFAQEDIDAKDLPLDKLDIHNYIPGTSTPNIHFSDLDIAAGVRLDVAEVFVNWLRVGVVGHSINISYYIKVLSNGMLHVNNASVQAFLNANPNIKNGHEIIHNLKELGYSLGETKDGILLDPTTLYHGHKTPKTNPHLKIKTPDNVLQPHLPNKLGSEHNLKTK